MKNLLKSLFFIFISLSIAGCTAPRVYNTFPADSATSQSASSFTTKPGSAKLYFVAGTMGYGAFTDPKILGGEFYINGVSVGKINANEILVIDVMPNTYTFTFEPFNNSTATRQPLIKTLTDGNILILRADLKMSGMALFLGPLAASSIATLTETNDRRLIAGRDFVSSPNCPNVICFSTSPTTNKIVNESESVKKLNNSFKSLQHSENKCRDLGFIKGTEKYADCVMKLSN